jgi:exopolyphosphatase/guanosine-5'-triphosphate,3'-diphosphate pyrophosphatase
VRTAILEINANTLLLLIVDEDVRRVVDLCRFVGRGLDASGRLNPKAISRSLKICREYRAVMEANAQDFITRAEKILGTRVEVLTIEREADLLALAVARTFPELAKTHYLVVDVGDSSTWILDDARPGEGTCARWQDIR